MDMIMLEPPGIQDTGILNYCVSAVHDLDFFVRE